MKKLYKIILKDKISDDVYKSYIIMSGPELRELYNFPDHEVMYIKEKGFSPGKLKIKKMYELCQRIYLLCESGYGIYKTVQYIVMNEDVDKFIRAVMFRVFLNFKSGMSVNKAFDVGEFDEYFIYSLKFVVNENTLVNIFRELNEYYLNFQRIKNEIFKAMLYPFILLFSVIVLLVFLNFYFIPSLSRLYGYDINLCFSRIVQNSVFIIFFIMFINFIFLFINDCIFVKIPIFGKMYKNYVLYIFTRNISVLTKNGIPIFDAFEKVIDNTRSKYILSVFLSVYESVVKGENIENVFKHNNKIKEFSIAVSISNKKGNYGEVFDFLCKNYYSSFKNSTDKILKVTEPFFILVISAVILSIVYDIYSGIFLGGMFIEN